MRRGTARVGTLLIGLAPRHFPAAMACSKAECAMARSLFNEAGLAPASSISRRRESKIAGVTSETRPRTDGVLDEVLFHAGAVSLRAPLRATLPEPPVAELAERDRRLRRERLQAEAPALRLDLELVSEGLAFLPRLGGGRLPLLFAEGVLALRVPGAGSLERRCHEISRAYFSLAVLMGSSSPFPSALIFSGSKRSRPPMRTQGIFPSSACWYTQLREALKNAATSRASQRAFEASLRSGC